MLQKEREGEREKKMRRIKAFCFIIFHKIEIYLMHYVHKFYSYGL